MKETIGGISLFQIVVVFILLFTAIMCLTINHSKAFAVKDEIINIIEKDGLASFSLNSDTATEISEYLNEAGYRITGKCDPGWVGYDRKGEHDNNNAAFCVKANNVADAYRDDIKDKCKNNQVNNCNATLGGYPDMIYYEIVLFYQLDIPLIGNAWSFKVYGSTKTLFS